MKFPFALSIREKSQPARKADTSRNCPYISFSSKRRIGGFVALIAVTVSAITINGDATYKANGTLNLTLSSATGGAGMSALNPSTLKIMNDDIQPLPTVVYVDDDWVGVANGDDPDDGGPATEMGYDAFARIQEGENGVAPAGTVNVLSGTYDEDVLVDNPGIQLLGAGAGATSIRGPNGGPETTVQVSASNATIAGFTITRLGNNTTDWNDGGLNSAGLAVQGLAVSNMLVRDNFITGNRTGIDINNSNGHTVRNNVIDFNRTGMILRNQTDFLTVVENFITHNWTVGVLFIDDSGGTNSPVQSALHGLFSNNDISENWYGQIVDRQSGGSLPAPGTTNLKNFRYNWFGTTSPVVTTANSAEPGYSAQIPVEYGGEATPPGSQPDVAGPASANLNYTPFLLSGTDTDLETTPGRGTNGFQGVQSQTVLVWPPNLNGWVIQSASTATAGFVPGPATPPIGVGSGVLSVGSDGAAAAQFRTPIFDGTSLSDLNEFSYSTYTSSDSTAPIGDQTVYVMLNVDKNADGAVDTLLFFVPEYQHDYTEEVPDQGDNLLNTWQTWNARIGGWYGIDSSTSNPVFAGPGSNVEPLDNFITAFPNARLDVAPGGSIRLVAGFGAGSWDNFVGNVDNVVIGVNTAYTTYDFEPPPQLSIDNVTNTEGNGGTTAFNFTVTLSQAADGPVTVNYDTADDSATSPEDFTAIPTTQLTFDPGETSKAVTVFVEGDTTLEADEEFFVNLSSASNATILDSQGVGTISDDDGPKVEIDIDDEVVAEPTSGTTTLTFTVSLSEVWGTNVTVDYFTQDGSATAPDDYDAIPPQTLLFTPGQTSQPITVTIKSDSLLEGPHKFLVRLTNPSSNGVIEDHSGEGTIIDPPAAGSLLISEFRFRGASGALDEYIELYNHTNSPILVATSDGSAGWTLCALDASGTAPNAIVLIPTGTVIPARGHLLAINDSDSGGYSLNGYAQGDADYEFDIADDGGVAVFSTATEANFTLENRLDAAGFAGPVDAAADLHREGAGLTSPGAVDGEYAFVRRLVTGLPQDTDDNAADFNFVANDAGTFGTLTAVLGASGPENCGCYPANPFSNSSPVQRNATVKASLIDPLVNSNNAPNRIRDNTPNGCGGPNCALGTLEIRRRFKNNTGAPLTRLRFRAVDVTTLNTPSPGGPQADVRWLNSVNLVVSTSGGPVTVRGTQIELPPTQSNSGGLNSSGVVTIPGGVLVPNATIDVRFVLGVQVNGPYRFYVNVEALP